MSSSVPAPCGSYRKARSSALVVRSDFAKPQQHYGWQVTFDRFPFAPLFIYRRSLRNWRRQDFATGAGFGNALSGDRKLADAIHSAFRFLVSLESTHGERLPAVLERLREDFRNRKTQ